MKLGTIFISGIISLTLCNGLALTASAQSPRAYASTSQLRTLLNRIETRTDAFQAEVQRSFVYNDSLSDQREDRIENLIGDFENATDTLRVRVNARQTLYGEVDDVFDRAGRINTFVSS